MVVRTVLTLVFGATVLLLVLYISGRLLGQRVATLLQQRKQRTALRTSSSNSTSSSRRSNIKNDEKQGPIHPGSSSSDDRTVDTTDDEDDDDETSSQDEQQQQAARNQDSLDSTSNSNSNNEYKKETFDLDGRRVGRLPTADHRAIHAALPNSTLWERRRFYVDKRGNVKQTIKALQQYYQWRNEYLSTTTTINPTTTNQTSLNRKEVNVVCQDTQDWNEAVALALRVMEEKNKKKAATSLWGISSSNSSESPKVPLPTSIPRIAQMYPTSLLSKTKAKDDEDNDNDNKIVKVTDQEGHKIVVARPALMDERIVPLPVYAHMFAIYLDRQLDRASNERLTLLIDARGGQGWRNLNGVQLLPFIQATCLLLVQMFPERLGKAIVFPVPTRFMWIWNLIQRCLDPVTATDTIVLAGSAAITAPPPRSEISPALLDPAVLDLVERERQALFVPNNSNSNN